ncbi:hypothetical protein ABH935_007029 [Catenulispora sp. GAS73]|uniref:hypothetical protein n=1 Tax=Catenulispora sp. GAS73 TaxID=3156269 RepID=UPI0035124854
MPPAFDPVELPYSLHVLWHLRGTTAPRPGTCHVIPGYTTTDHLPDMLAIRYMGSKGERDEVVIDHTCRVRRWQITARDANGAALGEAATNDEHLLDALTHGLFGIATPAAAIAQVEVYDADTDTTSVITAEQRPEPEQPRQPAEATVYLLTIAELDRYPDEYESGGKVSTADIDLNHVFEGAKSPRSAGEAEEFVGNLLWQMDEFPLELRLRAHEVATRAVADYPDALRRLAVLIADTSDGSSVHADAAGGASANGGHCDVRP